MDDLKIIILAGGKGTRLWPLSRENFPKQFIDFFGKGSLYEQTLQRALELTAPENIFVVASKGSEDIVRGYTFKVNKRVGENVLLEPEGKNTLPATLLATYKLNKEDVFLVMPSDHYIGDSRVFASDVAIGLPLAKEGNFVTFGIKPTKPETGYGYIAVEKQPAKKKYLQVKRFVEKPDLEKATRYLRDGNYYWNSGIFLFHCGAFLEAVKSFEPDIYKYFTRGEEQYLGSYPEIKSQSIDYGVMEPVDKKKVFMVPASFSWSDLGSFDAIYEILEKDEWEVAKEGKGDAISIDSRENLIFNDDKLVVTVGVEGFVYVETEDAVLLMKRGLGERLKEVNKILKERGKKEINYNKTGYRPWGYYTVILTGERYKIKKIVVNPGSSLSLQMHYHRSEHWIVIRGTAKVTMGEKIVYVHENESIYIPKSTLHRLENPGKVPLEIIEVQNGEYLEEDDIVRFDDAYGRCTY